MQDKKLIWQEKSRKKGGEYRIFTVDAVERVHEDGASNTFFAIESQPWITVIPLIKEDGVEKFVMVRQFRHGSATITTEFPAGIVDIGENPVEAAQRELNEEVAYRSHKVTFLGANNPNPALFTNHMHIFLAEDLTLLPNQELDPDERIEIVKIPVTTVLETMGYGEMDHALMVMALFWYQRHLMKNS
ncbi:NUDIX hydrolase [Entomospira culicis]|uniref:GDP-mannose pyrophosphatase n=1 Tax=Entomospira culicis TaxID=2719989 RepID=A0A968GJG9_9SPIO|nr:NUDIX hydrolase [Entomospira culicis]NIZ19285.1 NUDIX hydrolase [Entomospira culicis]NIZ69810.1 NUDIX hydrolase [Entomospira culicis]WDI36918.1 NUDIX hydrolase [Entomospira culicis]WDI38547.1 NUDIX hydrolase [Entomospira culicis]